MIPKFLRTYPLARRVKRFSENISAARRNPFKRILDLIPESYETLVCDVGANSGQFGVDLFSAGFKGTLISYEPASTPFDYLVRVASKYPNWTAKNLALGNANTFADLNIASNHGLNSSFLPKNESHASLLPHIGYIDVENARMTTFQEEYLTWGQTNLPDLVKIDVQGFEFQVLEGFGDLLKSINHLFLEISLKPLYAGEAHFLEILNYLAQNKHSVTDIFYGAKDNHGNLIQIDIITSRS